MVYSAVRQTERNHARTSSGCGFLNRKETLHRIAREAKQSDGENIANEVRGITI